MNSKISIELIKHRLSQALEELNASRLLCEKKYYKSANNRAYYSIFNSIRAVLALEPVDFSKHKTLIGYFNKNYVNTGIFSKELGHKISKASKVREDSDYDDEFIVSAEKTEEQIQTAEQVYEECKKYIEERIKK